MNASMKASPSMAPIGDGPIPPALAQLVRRLIAGWLKVVACVVVCTAAAIWFVSISPTVYRATTVLIPSSMDRGGLSAMLGSSLGSLGGLASMAGVNIGGASSSQTEEALAVLRSRQFNEDFIRGNDLLTTLYPKQWDAQTKDWLPGKRPELADAVRLFILQRTVAQDRKTNLVTLQLDGTDPAKVAAWTNDLVSRLNAEMRDRAIAKANASLDYLHRELDSTTDVGTRASINQLIASQINQRMLANVTTEFVFRVVDQARVPGRRDIVGPRRVMITGVGLMFGMFLGCALALLWPSRLKATSTI